MMHRKRKETKREGHIYIIDDEKWESVSGWKCKRVKGSRRGRREGMDRGRGGAWRREREGHGSEKTREVGPRRET